jgi:hypothetical protein
MMKTERFHPRCHNTLHPNAHILLPRPTSIEPNFTDFSYPILI